MAQSASRYSQFTAYVVVTCLLDANIDFISIYPSWQSAAPQLLLALIASVFLIINPIRK